MAKKREKILVYRVDEDQWMWPYCISRMSVATSYYQLFSKTHALRSARAFADKFKVPPEVVVEGEEDGKA